MNTHKTLSISSLLSTDDEPQREFSPNPFPSTISGANARFQSPPTTIPSNLTTKPVLISTVALTTNQNSVRDMRISSITDHARKDLSPMSVSNLMNTPTIDENIARNEQPLIPETAVTKNKEVPVISDTMANKPKKATKKESSVNDTTSNNRKDKTKKNDEAEKASSKDKESEQNEPLIITIDIPLSTHNDVHTEHNFTKLVEEKYGQFETQTPFTKGLWNFDGDGDAEGDEDGDGDGDGDGDADEDDDEEEDADLDGDTAPPSTARNDNEDEDDIVKALQIKFTPGMSDVEKESLVLKEIHRRKMVNNKRIGKYDVDDPFIDDEELEFEEETNANADGWFIWHGKLDITKKKKTPVPETRADRPSRAGKSSSVGGNSGLSSRSRNTANSNADSASSTTSNSGAADKRRKAIDSPVLDSPPVKRSKKPSASTAVTTAKSTTITAVTATPSSTPTASTTATASPEKKTSSSTTDGSKENNKIIIGSFGFGA